MATRRRDGIDTDANVLLEIFDEDEHGQADESDRREYHEWRKNR